MFEPVAVYSDQLVGHHTEPRMGWVVSGEAANNAPVTVMVLGNPAYDVMVKPLRGVVFLAERPRKTSHMEYCVPLSKFPGTKFGGFDMSPLPPLVEENPKPNTGLRIPENLRPGAPCLTEIVRP